MDDYFEPTEKLFRAVLPEGIFWREDGTLTSAAFKDPNGLSVDRDGGRALKEAVSFLQHHLAGQIVWVTVADCNEVHALVRYLPVEDNIYHSEIHKDEQKKLLSKAQARSLASSAQLVIESITTSNQ